MKTITTEQLRKWRDKNEDFLLVNVLGEDSFEEQHIAGSINIPASDDDFLKRIEKAADSKDSKIVVYCANKDCTASPKAARKLDKAGFTTVHDYEAGMAGWSESRLPVEVGA